MQLISITENAVSHDREHGNFKVLYQNKEKEFTSLVSAFIFYFNLSTEASLWDVTAAEVLLEKKINIDCNVGAN